MLTKTDLSRIQKVVKQEARSVVREETPKIIRRETPVIIHKETPKVIKKELTPVRRHLKRIEKKVDKTADFLDKENLKTVKRVQKIKTHFGITPPEPF